MDLVTTHKSHSQIKTFLLRISKFKFIVLVSLIVKRYCRIISYKTPEKIYFVPSVSITTRQKDISIVSYLPFSNFRTSFLCEAKANAKKNYHKKTGLK